jgi:hypothetical protein
MSCLAPSALRWSYGIRDCRVGAASICDVSLEARRTRLGGCATMLTVTQLKIFPSNHSGMVSPSLNYLHETQLNDFIAQSPALLAPPQQRRSLLREMCDEILTYCAHLTEEGGVTFSSGSET